MVLKRRQLPDTKIRALRFLFYTLPISVDVDYMVASRLIPKRRSVTNPFPYIRFNVHCCAKYAVLNQLYNSEKILCSYKRNQINEGELSTAQVYTDSITKAVTAYLFSGS